MQHTDIQTETSWWRRVSNSCRASLRRLLSTNVHIFLQGEEIGNMVVDDDTMQVTINIKSENNASTPSQREEKIVPLYSEVGPKVEELQQNTNPKRYWDAFIDTYTKIGQELYIKGDSDQLKNLQKLILSKMRSLGIVSFPVDTNVELDAEKMEANGFLPTIPTDKEALDGKVAKVITPVFYFQPTYNSQEGQIMLKKAEVILYELSE